MPKNKKSQSNKLLIATPVTARRRVMVYIHGAGNFPNDFYKPLVAALEKRLGGPFPYIPVYYADVTNPLQSIAALQTKPESPQAAKFRQAFEKEMQKSYEAIPPSERAPAMMTLTLPGGINVTGTLPKEVTLYLFDSNVSSQIQQRLTTALDNAVKNYDDIVLVSHSLGTVVAFDVLKQSADRYNKISILFTLGCPLLKLRHLFQRDANLGAIKYQNVARWHNIYDTTDFIADAIGSGFPKPGYRLHDIFVDVALDPISSHDYPNNSETQDMIADAMR